jgi:hypothetical protein
VTSEEYRRILIRYIDFNPVEAGLVSHPMEYPHGSARRLLTSDGPPWLERSWYRARLLDDRLSGPLDVEAYGEAFGSPLNPALSTILDRRSAQASQGPDPLDELLDAAPDRVLAWMDRKANLADGTEVGLPICDVDTVHQVVEDARRLRTCMLPAAGRGRPRDVWAYLENALLRDLCACSGREIGVRLGRSVGWSWKAYQNHQALLTDPAYQGPLSELAASALARSWRRE